MPQVHHLRLYPLIKEFCNIIIDKSYQVLFYMHNDYSVPEGFSITISQVSSDCRRRTMVPRSTKINWFTVGLPSAMTFTIIDSVIVSKNYVQRGDLDMFY